jgi:NADH-quinone oxidoreductase subunit A
VSPGLSARSAREERHSNERNAHLPKETVPPQLQAAPPPDWQYSGLAVRSVEKRSAVVVQLLVIPNKLSLRREESGRAARSVALFATQLSCVWLASLPNCTTTAILLLEVKTPERYYGLLRRVAAEKGRTHLMPQNYVPIFIFIAIVGTLLPLTLLLAKLVRPENPSKTKLMPYECGIDPVDNARGRYTVRYYIIAILFVVFDVETIFLFPWAVRFKAMGLFGLIEMLIFLIILIVGYIWVWKKGALEWV